MQIRRSVTTGLLLIIGSALMSGCAQKPVFSDPELIIDHPPLLGYASSSLSSSSHRSIQTKASSSKTISSASSIPVLGSPSRPASLLIRVPFASQSPFAVWDQLHEEACEEASLIMVHHFLAGTELTASGAEAEIQSMVAWEREHGYADDVDATQLGAIAQSLYGYRARVLTNVTADHLRLELARGNPIIIPAFGRALGNPFFSGEGPFYHMLVVIGYTADGFITNDPGTKRGEQYWYSTDVLMHALHDWIGVKELIATGPKNALVVEP